MIPEGFPDVGQNTEASRGTLYSIVVPVYNSEKSLRELHGQIATVFEQSIVRAFELLLIDDGSSDASWNVMQELRSHDPRVRIFRMARNFGQHPALMCGFANVRGDFVVTLDDDLQHPPEEIAKLVAALDAHPEIDVVIGNYETKQHSWIRNLGTRMMNTVSSRIFSKPTTLRLTSFRAMRASVASEIAAMRVARPRIGQLLLLVTRRIVNVEVRHEPRHYGRSGYTFGRLLKDFVLNIVCNSTFPLQAISVVGSISALLSFGLAVYYVARYFTVGIAVQGWTTLIVVCLFHFGLLLLAVGLIGRYLLQILLQTRFVPLYVVRDRMD